MNIKIMRDRAFAAVNTHRKTAIVSGVAIAMLSAGTGTALAMTSTRAPAAGTPAVLTQPPSAAAVSSQLHLTGFTDCGPAPLGGVTDSGVAYSGSVKYGIDTFPAVTERNTWVQTAAQFGVVVDTETATWVLYSATDQAKGC